MMTALTVRLPNSVHQKVQELALRDEISVNQFIATAVSEKMASIMTLDYLRQEAANGRRADFEKYMNLVPAAPIVPGDELPAHGTEPNRQKRQRRQPGLRG
jgi:predicted transcriptional regulator